jgi:PhnB protein
MKLSPHLSFDGQCEAAFRFYERSIGGKLVYMLTYSNSPIAEQVPLEWRGKIVHATLMMGNYALLGADVLPEQYEKPQGSQLVLSIDDPLEAERIFEALAENGTILMPLQKTFWAARFGVLVDQFGVKWEINCGQPES